MQNKLFDIAIDKTNGGVLSIVSREDKFNMNWCKKDTPFGMVKGYELLSLTQEENRVVALYENGSARVQVIRGFNQAGNYCESYTFSNPTEHDLFFKKGDIGIYTPFHDNYESSEICSTQRCHTHIWCGWDVSYINALRMGGMAPHLGLVVTEGSLCAYSVERDFEKSQNDRGNFILHPAPFSLAKGESYTLSWELFWHKGTTDFYNILTNYPNFILVRVFQYTVFEGENIRISAQLGKKVSNIEILCDGEAVPYILERGIIKLSYTPKRLGEHQFIFCVDNVRTYVNTMVLPAFSKLTRARCEFITKNQQFHKEGSPLNGAYLIYDNDDNTMYYSHRKNDHNAGRERVGMGVLVAKYLQRTKDEEMLESLMEYVKYVKRELYNEKTGEVYNDVMQDKTVRMHNYPYFATFFMEIFLLTKDEAYLDDMYRILLNYYKNGGKDFYAICIPMVESVTLLHANGRSEEADHLQELYKEHVDVIMENGVCYPSDEVAFKQNIVAPAASYTAQMYKLTGLDIYMEAAQKQVEVLSLFNGKQPDYHLNEVSIRHMDGYYFSKCRMFGDLFPHHGSSLNALAYKYFSDIKDDKAYMQRASRSLRNSLCLFRPDGSASCAYFYPYKINGVRGQFFDDWANDQDWALYFAMKLI